LIRAVADTHIYISGIFWPGLNRMILNLARHDLLALYASPKLFQELTRTMKGKKFRLSDEQVDVLIHEVMGYTLPGKEATVSTPHLRDPKDQFLCDLAAGSNTNYLVTGDRDLLVLKKIGKTQVVTPRFLLEKEFPDLIEAFEKNV
jgi:hypothetical protein